MDLEQYRVSENLTYTAIAEGAGLSGHSRAYRIAHGLNWPLDPEVIERIIRFSGGKVTVEGMYRRWLASWRARQSVVPPVAAE